MDKKGVGKVVWITVVLVIVIIAGSIILLFTAGFAGGLSRGASESACKFASQARSAAPYMEKILTDPCGTQLVEIIPDEWDKCDDRYEEMEDAAGCAAHQLVHLMYRCWDMRGGGEWDAGDLVCYHVEVLPPEDEDYYGVEIKVNDINYVRNNIKVTNFDFTYDDLLGHNIYFYDDFAESKGWKGFWNMEGTMDAVNVGDILVIIWKDEGRLGDVLTGVMGLIPGISTVVDNIEQEDCVAVYRYYSLS